MRDLIFTSGHFARFSFTNSEELSICKSYKKVDYANKCKTRKVRGFLKNVV